MVLGAGASGQKGGRLRNYGPTELHFAGFVFKDLDDCYVSAMIYLSEA